MSLTRRALLSSAAIGTGLLATGCVPDLVRPKGNLPSTDWVVDRLDQLIANTGQDHFRRLTVRDGSLTADLLVSRSVVRQFQHYSEKTGWEEPHSPNVLDPEVDPPTSAPLAELHLDRMPQWDAQLRETEDGLVFNVDETGHLHLWASGGGEVFSLLLDGSGRYPLLSDDLASDVVRAIKEIVAEYGDQAQSVGGLNDFVHVDCNVAGSTLGMRVIRYATIGPQATVTDALFSPETIFDPLTVDPTLALELLKTIPAKAKLKGQAWDWRISRPPTGGEPTLSYGVGTDGPTQRVWVDASGKIIGVQQSDCIPGTGWCPR